MVIRVFPKREIAHIIHSTIAYYYLINLLLGGRGCFLMQLNVTLLTCISGGEIGEKKAKLVSCVESNK